MSRVAMPAVLAPGAIAPTYAHFGDAGADLCSIENTVIPPGARARVRTGVSVAVPAGHVAMICPRSGLAARYGVTVLNAPGIIDSGYRGELEVILFNADPSLSHEVHAGDRIAQLVLVPFATAVIVPVDELAATSRGAGGFGSTGGIGAVRS